MPKWVGGYWGTQGRSLLLLGAVCTRVLLSANAGIKKIRGTRYSTEFCRLVVSHDTFYAARYIGAQMELNQWAEAPMVIEQAKDLPRSSRMALGTTLTHTVISRLVSRHLREVRLQKYHNFHLLQLLITD